MSIATHPRFPNLLLVEHPLIAHKMALLRDKSTPTKTFKELVHEITLFLAYEVTKDLPTTTTTVETPLESFETTVMAGKKPVILPILRAGIGMVEGFLQLMPAARVGHIGLYRDEATLTPHRYYFKIPAASEDRQFFVCDPMLATGGSASIAIEELKRRHISRITFVCLVAAPEGVKHLLTQHPDVAIYCAALDRQLSDSGYILPGLGDAGDRLFGTR